MQFNGSSSGPSPAVPASVEASAALPLAFSRQLPGGGEAFEFVIDSDFMQGRVVQGKIIGAIEGLKYGDGDLFAVRLALEEALINAIKHGNRFDPAKRVEVKAEVTPETVEIIIHDQGAGFDRSAVPDPTLEENLERNSGRGIMLIEAYMTEVSYGDGGRRLRMVKKRESEMAK